MIWFNSEQIGPISIDGLVDPLCGLYMFACSIYDVRNSGLLFSYFRFSFANVGSPVILF